MQSTRSRSHILLLGCRSPRSRPSISPLRLQRSHMNHAMTPTVAVCQNTIQSRPRADQVCRSFGIKTSTNTQVVLLARNAGYDSLFIDLEHAWLSLGEASNLCMTGLLAGVTPFVRVPHQCGNGFVQRVLDGGAMGVVFPHVHSAADAKAAVAITKYPPHGCRSMTGLQPIFGMRHASFEQAREVCNSSASTVFAMIESEHGVEAVDEIAAVEGVDVVLVGSNDLAIDLGVAGQFRGEKFRAALEQVSQACKKHGKVFGVAGIYDSLDLQEWIVNTLGARFMLVQQDVSLIASGAVKAIGAFPAVKSSRL